MYLSRAKIVSVLLCFTAPNLNITKTASRTPVDLGDSIQYTITVSNSGTAEATDVTVTDALPAGLRFSGSAQHRVAQGEPCCAACLMVCCVGAILALML